MSAELLTAHISELRVYPVKSTGVLEVEQEPGVFTARLPEAILSPQGLETTYGIRDHEFMWVTESGDENRVHHFLTQRKLRALVHMKPQFTRGNLQLTWNRLDPITVALDRNSGAELLVEIHNEILPAVDQGEAIAAWGSDHLNTKVRLVKAAGSFRRNARTDYVNNINPMWFQDGYPIHWLDKSSVSELDEMARAFAGRSNGKYQYEKIHWEAFRPQIVTEGFPAQYEHRIYKGKMSGVLFLDPKPCGRCVIPRGDQETGEVHALDPNTVLAQYKLWKDQYGDTQTLMGENMLPLGREKIQIGDEVGVLALRQPQLVYGNRETFAQSP